jgi:hypothetical protein
MIDAEKLLGKMVGQERKDVFDFYVMLSLLYTYGGAKLDGEPFGFIYENETYEEVNNHGNETGVFKTRQVRNVCWKDKIWSEQELRIHLKEVSHV